MENEDRSDQCRLSINLISFPIITPEMCIAQCAHSTVWQTDHKLPRIHTDSQRNNSIAIRQPQTQLDKLYHHYCYFFRMCYARGLIICAGMSMFANSIDQWIFISCNFICFALKWNPMVARPFLCVCLAPFFRWVWTVAHINWMKWRENEIWFARERKIKMKKHFLSTLDGWQFLKVFF